MEVAAPLESFQPSHLYGKETLEIIEDAPMIKRYIPGDPTQPLVVFIPGAAHLARVAYGGHKGSRNEDFLAYWLTQQGLGLLALSYPLETDPPTMPAVRPDFTIQEWGRQAAEATRDTVKEHKLSKRIVVLGWSMAGRILEPISSGLKKRGLMIELFVSLAATPAMSGLRGPLPGIEVSAAGYSSSARLFEYFMPQMAEEVHLNGGRTIIDEDIYRKEYVGRTPIGLAGWGYSWSKAERKLVEDKWGPIENAAADNYSAFPIMAALYPTSILDIRHTLGDRATWNIMLTYKLLTDVMGGNRWTTERARTLYEDATRTQKIRDFVHTAGNRLAIEIEGNHFFFIGEKGAKETAQAISDLIVRAQEVQGEFQALIDGL